MLQQDCHHHLHNVWIGALTKDLSKYLDGYLAADLDVILFMLRVNTIMDVILHAVDKEFTLLVNYPKGHGDQFQHWLKKIILVCYLSQYSGHQSLSRTWQWRVQQQHFGIASK